MKLQRKTLKAPEFVGLRWINSPPISVESLKGQVVLVDFWDFSCINCIRTIPYLKIWHGRYADRGLMIIGIHAPEFSFAQSEKRVLEEVDFLGLFYPVAIDNNFTTWRRYSNRFWPAKYLIDKEGYLADYHFGEGGYTRTEQAVQELLREINPRMILPKVLEPLRTEDSDDAKMKK
ncbi:MAG: redoxin domain-containing protein, partial [Deltaproteobacteria bacterium]|nr:redoxin domain-containing protein [Deltaproteobacteria bacterium]